MTYSPSAPDFHFRKFGGDYIVRDDTAGAKNLIDATLGRVRYIQVLAAGTITFRHDDDTLSVPIPVAANQSLQLGLDTVHIMLTGTSLSDVQIIPYWA